MERCAPKYVRAANVSNKTGITVKLLAKFDESEQVYTVAPGDNAQVEGTINMGTWTAVDPLRAITVYGPDDRLLAEKLLESTGGVKICSLDIVGDSQSVDIIETN